MKLKYVAAFCVAILISTCVNAQGVWGKTGMGIWGDTLAVWGEDVYVDEESNGTFVNNLGSVFVVSPNETDQVTIGSTGLKLNGPWELRGNGVIYLNSDIPILSETFIVNTGRLGMVDFANSININNSLELRNGLAFMNDYVLTLESDNDYSLIGGSDSSYIVGTMKRKIFSGGSKLFPIGSENLYKPVMVNNAHGLTEEVSAAFDEYIWNPLEPELVYNSEGGWLIDWAPNRTTTMGLAISTPMEGLYTEGKTLFESLQLNKNDYPLKEWNRTFTVLSGDGSWYSFPEIFESSYLAFTESERLPVYAPNLIVRYGSDPYLVFENLELAETSELQIRNREGLTVYTIQDYQNDLNMTQFEDGTYYYVLKYELNNRVYVEKSFIEVATPRQQ